MTSARNALVLGATGSVGKAIAQALSNDGWSVRALRRTPGHAKEKLDVEWQIGDAMHPDDVERAARDVSVIVHAVNPVGYRDWDKLVLPMARNTIAAAKAAGGARIVLPGTIYNFDPSRTPLVTAKSEQSPPGPKGRVRVALEEMLRDASGELPILILRAGDFFGPDLRLSWFSQAMVAPGERQNKIVNPVQGRSGHSWAYLPDLALALIKLLAVPQSLEPCERVQFAGFYDGDGTELISAIQRALGRELPVRSFPWWLMHAVAPFGGFPTEAAEIARYWRYPMRLDNHRLCELIGREPHTPLDDAVAATLKGLKCS